MHTALCVVHSKLDADADVDEHSLMANIEWPNGVGEREIQHETQNVV